jgi:hypothetical protein
VALLPPASAPHRARQAGADQETGHRRYGAVLGRPKDAKKLSVTGIRRAFNDGSLFQTDPLKRFALKD